MPEYDNTFPVLSGSKKEELKRKRRKRLKSGSFQDAELQFITDANPQLEQWRVYAADWFSQVKNNLGGAAAALRMFIFDYIVAERLPTDPSILLSFRWQQENSLPIYKDTALEGHGEIFVSSHFTKAAEFVDYVLLKYYSAEDDYGRQTVSGDYHNFLWEQASDIPRKAHRRTHSNKHVLPSIYIRYLRELFCPEGSHYFSDLTWAHNAMPSGDWFEVSPDVIDKDDPDCVWRLREATVGADKKRLVYEIWSPVRAVALMVNLEIPLRTHQVRLLDSGEGDVRRYEGSRLERNDKGEWIYFAGGFVENKSSLMLNLGETGRNAGVFRPMVDQLSQKTFAGLYINTNKTNDRDKDQWDRGYEVPWEHGKVLYWCERLRNWQEKYNPVDDLVSCMSLDDSILGKKSDVQKKQMGSMVFLFRNAAAKGEKRHWPIARSHIRPLWLRALKALEELCAKKGHFTADGSPLRFVDNGGKSQYSPHSLRVSLITHLANEGGVEMHILSECIAGHARILMTLYYKKSGVVYVSEAMDAATERIKDETIEQQNYVRWMQEASIKQLEINSAAVDASVFHHVKDAFSRGGVSLLRTNLGLCAKGGMGCHDGGTIVDEESGAVSYGPTPGYPQRKNCVRCRWFVTGPAFLQALVHHWNLLHFNLGDSGHRYIEVSSELAELESAMLDCQKLKIPFDQEARLEQLRQTLGNIYEGNEQLAIDSLATMKLIVRCKHIIDAAAEHDSGVVLVAVGGVEEVTINVRECSELEQVLTAALGSTIYIDQDASKAILKAGNAFDRMLMMNGKAPVFFNLSEKELPLVVSHMTKLLQAYAGSIGRAVPFVEGAKQLSALGLFGSSTDILNLASAGTPLRLTGSDERGPILTTGQRKAIPLTLLKQ